MIPIIKSISKTTRRYWAQVELQFTAKQASSTYKSFKIRVKE